MHIQYVVYILSILYEQLDYRASYSSNNIQSKKHFSPYICADYYYYILKLKNTFFKLHSFVRIYFCYSNNPNWISHIRQLWAAMYRWMGNSCILRAKQNLTNKLLRWMGYLAWTWSDWISDIIFENHRDIQNTKALKSYSWLVECL